MANDIPVVKVGHCGGIVRVTCGEAVVQEPIWLCGITNVATTFNVTEADEIEIPGGFPGEVCFSYTPPNTDEPPQVDVTLCPGTNPVWEAMLGRYEYTKLNPADPTEVAPDQTVDANVGILIERLKGAEANCFCSCAEEGVSCTNRLEVALWRRAFCRGKGGQVHPGGRYWIDYYPALEFSPQTQTINATNDVDDGETYTFTAYENDVPPATPLSVPVIDPATGGYTGAVVAPAAADLSKCHVGFTSNVCPPFCGCGGCSSNDLPPITAGLRASSRTVSTSTDDKVAA